VWHDAAPMDGLRYYLDFISPYAYLGWPQARALAERRGVPLRPVPVLFAALLDANGQKGPAEIEPKRIYTFKHVTRVAHDLGLPLRPPPAHPFNPLLALRVASLPELSDEERLRAVDWLYALVWATGEGVTDPGIVARALDAADLPGAAMVAEAGTPEAKERVRKQTEDAIARGVFGVPSIEVERTGEIFWGQDAIPHVERHLAGEDAVTPEWLERWRDLPAGAIRPGAR
jgi:2-hydroxychromene-2-carboxylate isomerase